jgi:Ca-activated chloride channel family protein
MKRATVVLALIAALATSALVADETPSGVIIGRVTADTTGTPLAYANVIVVGTNLGAMSKADGRYRIEGVATGTYVVRAMMMGFKQAEVKNIKVESGTSTTVDFVMHHTIVAQTQEIVVTADKPMVEVTSSDCKGSVSSEQLTEMPIDKVLEAVALKAGTVKTGDDLHVRGGRSGEVRIQMDGAAVHDPLGSAEADATGTERERPHRKYRCEPRPAQPSVRYPHAPWNTEDYAHVEESTFKLVADHQLSTFSVDVDAASYANVRRYVTAGHLPPPDAVRIEELINYFQYRYPDPEDEHPFSITTEVAGCPWNPEHRLVHIGLQGERVSTEDMPPANLVFLLDVSGSMSSPNKLPLVQRAMNLLIDHLREEDRVAMVVYAGAAGLVLDSTPGNRKDTLRSAVNRLRAGGSTAGAAGIKLAYQVAEENFRAGGNNRVILATDGDFNIGVSSDSEMQRLIEEKRESGVFLTVLGFGMGNIKDNKMEILADKGNGNYAYIDDIFEARKVLVHEMGALFTIAKDVKIQVEFNPAKVAAYRLVGYENRALNREDFDDDKKDAGEIGAGHSVTALYEIVPADGAAMEDDGLKYTRVELDPEAAESRELLTVKFRYKEPDARKSTLIEQVLLDETEDFDEMSEDFRFAAAVAEYGMLLRGSKFSGVASWQHVIDTARSARGRDYEGYRAEFVRLAQISSELAQR